MSTSLSQTITQALIQAQRSAQLTVQSTASLLAPAPQYCKATAKSKHASKNDMMDSLRTVTDGASLPLRKRTTSRAKSSRLWKRARAQLDSSGLSDIEEEFDESIMGVSDDQFVPESGSAKGKATTTAHSRLRFPGPR
ncbi:Hypothetical predicted protein [Pelobates cultripes]|uniref:Uncharacterized protein n=1 Tax=Pelobates cultripes TaxID=61616 RepID=A0AAD1T8S7_PELCU|nr:Hypothetical predicted protein [Pelobates cultripes]